MIDSKTINGFRVATHEHRDRKIPTHARELCAALERDHHAVDRIDYTHSLVTVWMDHNAPRSSFTIPDGWQVARVGAYGGAIALDLEREDGG